MIPVKEKEMKAFDAMKQEFGYTNKMQAPRLVKIVVSSGTGSLNARDKRKAELVGDRLTKITGQKPALRSAKQSIAAFKLREGEPIGYQVTLRGGRMYEFLDKLLNVALPRTKDFKGIPLSAIDEMGNYTLGIKENSIFPETADEDIKDVFGFGITVVTTAGKKQEAEVFLRHMGFPFRKNNENETAGKKGRGKK